MSEDYVLYRSFTTVIEAETLIALLQKNRIPFVTENTSSPMDPVIVGFTSDPDLRVKLHPSNFAKVDSLLDEYYDTQAANIPKDYYLFEFTDAELYDIIEKPDEWGTLDYKLAQQILKERGLELAPEHIHQLKAKRLTEIARPEELSTEWIIVGYLSALTVGIIGIFFGYVVTTSKKALPDGSRKYIYTQKTRTHGRNILVIAIISTVLFAYFNFFAESHH